MSIFWFITRDDSDTLDLGKRLRLVENPRWMSIIQKNETFAMSARQFVPTSVVGNDFYGVLQVKVLSRNFRLAIGCIEHFQIVTTSNYSSVANSHTPHFTTAYTKSSLSAVSSPVVVW
jgi:hypothetical protein